MDRNAPDLYLKQVKKELRCSARQKRALVQPLSQALQEYVQENGAVTVEQVTAAFGTPQQQAQDFMETLEASEFKKAFTLKRIVLIGVIAALVIWCAVAVAALIDGHNDIQGYSKTVISDFADEDLIVMESVTS